MYLTEAIPARKSKGTISAIQNGFVMNWKLFFMVTAILTSMLLTPVLSPGWCEELPNSEKYTGGRTTPPKISSDILTSDKGCSQELVDLLNARAAEMDAREEKIRKREQELKLLQEEILEKIKLLKKMQRQLEGPIKKRAAEEEAKLQHLAGVYSSMDPGRAAALLNKLDDETVTKLFSIMKSKKVAAILANMEPEKAARISKFLYKDVPPDQY